MRRVCLAAISLSVALGAAAGSAGPVKHVIVYNEPGRFAGWPANNGIWSWGDEIILRDDGGTRDLGYPRTVQRADGHIVTVYYFNDKTQVERYIAATIWDPGEVAN